MPSAWLTFSLTVVGGLLTIVLAYYAFSSKLSITPSGSLNPSDPFATPFVLQNDSLLWVNLVKPYHCSLRKITTEDYLVFQGIDTAIDAPPIPRLDPGESTAFFLPFRTVIILRAPINYADIEVVVSYYPAFIPFYKKEKRVRFVTIKSKE